MLGCAASAASCSAATERARDVRAGVEQQAVLVEPARVARAASAAARRAPPPGSAGSAASTAARRAARGRRGPGCGVALHCGVGCQARCRMTCSAARARARAARACPPGSSSSGSAWPGYRLTLRGRDDVRRPVRLARAAARRCSCAARRCPDAGADRALRARARPAAILVGHTHWDHAVDAPALARRYGCAGVRLATRSRA